MKKKRIPKKKILIAGGLVLSCAVVLAVVLYLKVDHGAPFVPDASQTVEPTDVWTEITNPSTAPTDTWVDPNVPGVGTEAADPEQQYPKEVSNDDEEVVIQFTEPATKPAPPEEPPKEAEHSAPATSQAPTAPNPTPKQENNAKPPASIGESTSGNGSGGSHSGQVYDPVFGWIDVAEGNGQKVDSSGDPNKMVGTMGD